MAFGARSILVQSPQVSRTNYGNLLSRYRRYASGYDRRFARYSEGTLNKALTLVPDAPADLLDVACGTGLFEAKLRRHRPEVRVIATDISPDMLRQARARFAGDDMIRFAEAGAERLPVPDASQDMIVCNNAFHLIQDAAGALNEFHRVLRPEGRVIIVDWCLDFPAMKAFRIGLRATDRQVRSIRTIGQLSELMARNGFAVIHAERFRVPPLWGLMAVVGRRADA